MSLIGNWEERANGVSERLSGRINILGAKEGILEVSIDDGVTWVTVYTFPNKAGLYELYLSTVTDVRVTVTPAANWSFSRFNEMSG